MSQVNIKPLTDYLNKYTKEVSRKTAGLIRDELADTATSAIAEFYEHYTPKHYHRHYYNFKKNSFQKYYSNPHGTVYRGGIELTPDLMDDIYSSPTYQVFDTVYAGFHGIASTHIYPRNTEHQFVPPRMIPSPMEIILKKQKKIQANMQHYITQTQNMIKL